MATIHNLWYRHKDRYGGDLAMTLGTYSTIDKAKEGMDFLQDKPGFADYGLSGFSIESRKVDVTYTSKGEAGSEGELVGQTYYALWHYRIDERDYDHDTLLGTYSSEAKAQQGLSITRDLPEFNDLPDSFEILDGTVDHTDMREGFVTIYHGEE